MVVPASPVARRLRRPSWLDPRVATGILLIAVSVTTGARIVGGADRSVQVWALTRDVSAGTVLVRTDVEPARVRLFDSGPRYLQAAGSPAGRTASRDLSRGELLPASAVIAVPPTAIVAVPVPPQNAPALTHGQAVDVWATVKGCSPVRVLAGVPVQEVRSDRAGALSVSAGAVQVVLRVAPADAARLMAALGAEAVIRLVVLDGAVSAAVASGPASCRRPGDPASGEPADS